MFLSIDPFSEENSVHREGVRLADLIDLRKFMHLACFLIPFGK